LQASIFSPTTYQKGDDGSIDTSKANNDLIAKVVGHAAQLENNGESVEFLEF